jgi:hypothetical protein
MNQNELKKNATMNKTNHVRNENVKETQVSMPIVCTLYTLYSSVRRSNAVNKFDSKCTTRSGVDDAEYSVNPLISDQLSSEAHMYARMIEISGEQEQSQQRNT